MLSTAFYSRFKRFLSNLTTAAFAAALAGVITPAELMAKPSTSADASFLDQFSEHHKGAIKMSKLAKSRAHDPELKRIAQKMISEQTEEIDQMASWRRQYFAGEPHAAHEMPKMDMSKLEKKKGRAFDREFIDMMSKHHEQGIEMAKKTEDKLFHPQVKTFARNAAAKQEQDRLKLTELRDKASTAPKSSAE